MKKILTLLIVASISFVALSEVAISVDGDVVTKKDVMKLAQKVYKSKQNANLTQSEEAEIIRNVFIDLEFWRLAAAEIKSRNINLNTTHLIYIRSSGLVKNSEYVKLDRGAALNEATAIIVAIRLMNLNPSIILTSDGKRNLRDQFIARYARDHKIELADYSAWKIKRQRGTFVLGSDYNAIEEELDEDTNVFFKAIYYVHRYTIRYYVVFLRWYVEKVAGIAGYFKEKGNENAAIWVSRILYWILPYIAHVIVLFICLAALKRRPSVIAILLKGGLLMIASVLLYFVGMSPWLIFVVFVLVPVFIIYMLPGLARPGPTTPITVSKRNLYKFNEYGVPAPTGSAYTDNGEEVFFNDSDFVYNSKYTKAGELGVESEHNRVYE